MPLPVVTSGIGTNDATCIPDAEAELPCQIVVVDVATEGDTLTVAGSFDVGSGEGAADDETEAEGEAEGEAEAEAPEDLPQTGTGITSLILAGTGSLAVAVARLRRRS